MNILFLTIFRVADITQRGIYTDLIRKFKLENHNVFVACPNERKFKESTIKNKINGIDVLKIWTLNAQKTSLIEKGLCTLMIDYQFKNAIKRQYNNVKFDLVLYSTPPVTFTNTISYIKKRDKAVTYLLLKDIFPQNAVDLNFIRKNSIIYKYFRKKEIQLYNISDYIGCLSPANVDFLIKHNKQINKNIIEVNPNTIELLPNENIFLSKTEILNKYKIPSNSVLFIYGGNLGKPQGINFLMEVLESNISRKEIYFIIVGNGTEFNRLKIWHNKFKRPNFSIIKSLPKNEYDELNSVCDVGLIFLDNRFTIPNIPSRLLSYLENSMPILAATDVNTDLKNIIENADCGFWAESGDLITFNKYIDKFINNRHLITEKGFKSRQLIENEFQVERTYKLILNKIIL